jgi:hypothetical protein
MKASDLTAEERELFAPWYVKVARFAAVLALALLCCVDDVPIF